jgi:hypothetical protein
MARIVPEHAMKDQLLSMKESLEMTQASSQILEVERGVWISEQWLREAGLGPRIRVTVQPREIRILDLLLETLAGQEQPSERGWQMLRALGADAEPGRLPNAAPDHDRYLYAKSR